VEAELRAHIALLAMAQDVAETACCNIKWPVHVLRLRRRNGEALVEASKEARKESIAGIDVTDAGQAHGAMGRRVQTSCLPTTRSESVEREAQRREFDSLYAAASNG